MFPCPQSLHAQMLMHLHVPAVELADFWNTLCPTRWQELIQIWLGSSAFVHMSLAAVLVWGFASIAGSEGLTDWIHDLGGFVSRKVKLKADGHGGRGLFVTADVDEGETLVSVPLQAMVLGEHATNATPCAGAIRRFFDQSPDQADRGRTHALFSMMVLLLSILDGDSRAEWPHLDDLLNHWSKGQQQRFPLLWPNWALREIEGTTASLVYAIARGGVEREYSELLRQTCPEIAGKFNLQEYKKIWALVNSRVLTYPGSSFAQPQPALVPLFDLVNHQLPVPVVPLPSLAEIQSHQAESLGRFGTEPQNGHLQLWLRRPLREVREATEVTDVYGLQSNEESLWTFGFTVPWIHNLTCLTRSRLTLKPEDLPYISLSRPGFGWALSSDLLRALEPHLSFTVGGCAAQSGPSGPSGPSGESWQRASESLQPLLAFLRAWIASTRAESFPDLREACALTVPRPLQPVLRLPDLPGLFQETWSMGPCRYLNLDDERLLSDFLLGVLEEKRSEMAGGSLLDEERLLQRKGRAGVWQDAVVLRRDEKFLLQELTDWLSRERRRRLLGRAAGLVSQAQSLSPRPLAGTRVFYSGGLPSTTQRCSLIRGSFSLSAASGQLNFDLVKEGNVLEVRSLKAGTPEKLAAETVAEAWGI